MDTFKEFDKYIIDNFMGEYLEKSFDILPYCALYEIKGKVQFFESAKKKEYEICCYVKNYDCKYSKYLNLKKIYSNYDCDNKNIILRRYIAIKIKEHMSDMSPECGDEILFKDTYDNIVINPFFKNKYILYRNKSQSIYKIYNTFQDFIVSGDKYLLSNGRSNLKTTNCFINEAIFERIIACTQKNNPIFLDSTTVNLPIKNKLLNMNSINNIYDLLKSKIYGVADNGLDYEEYLWDQISKHKNIFKTTKKNSVENKKAKHNIEIIEKKLQEYRQQDSESLINDYTEAKILYSHEEYLNYLNGFYKLKQYKGDCGYYIYKIDETISQLLGCNDEFEQQFNNLDIFMN